jgi:hypothetical protein
MEDTLKQYQKPRHRITLSGIKLAHKGSVNKRFIQQNQGIENNVLKANQEALLSNVENYHLQFERINFSEVEDSIIFL